MPLPSPNERPDLYDSFDLPAQSFVPDAAYREATMPQWMRQAIAAHARQPPQARSAPPRVQVMTVQRVAELMADYSENAVTPMEIAVVAVPESGATDLQARRRREVQELRWLADELERGVLEPGPLIVNLPLQR